MSQGDTFSNRYFRMREERAWAKEESEREARGEPPRECFDFLFGHCARGHWCRFKHSESSEEAREAFRASHDACVQFKLGRCSKGAACHFRHEASTRPCRFFAEGRCRKGRACPFPHPGEVAHAPETDPWGRDKVAPMDEWASWADAAIATALQEVTRDNAEVLLGGSKTTCGQRGATAANGALAIASRNEVAPEPQALVCTDCAVSGDGVASGAARGRLPDMESLSAMAVAALAAPVKPHPLVGVDRSASTADALYFGRI